MFAVSATRTNQGAAAILARKRAEVQAIAKAEQRRKEQEALEAQRAKERAFELIVAKFKEVELSFDPPQLTAKEIIKHAISGTSYSYSDILGTRRMRDVISIRHFAILSVWAFKPDYSLPKIGQVFRKDHTTILHAVNRFGFQSREDAARFIKAHGRDATIARLKDGRGA